jgi:adenosylcobyric acid synthase
MEGHLTIDGAPVRGYEIHAGVTSGKGLERPLLVKSDGAKDGSVSEDDNVAGTYLHGVFESTEGLSALLKWAGLKNVDPLDYWKLREEDIENLADKIETCLDSEKLFNIIQNGNTLDDNRATPLGRVTENSKAL